MTQTPRSNCAIMPPSAKHPIKLASERQRRLRERKRRGGVLVQFEIVGSALDDLIALGWLSADRRGHKEAVMSAVIKLAGRALSARLRPWRDA